jgi:hypothetical protein
MKKETAFGKIALREVSDADERAFAILLSLGDQSKQAVLDILIIALVRYIEITVADDRQLDAARATGEAITANFERVH